MGKAPWNPVPGWDVPRDYYAPDEPTADEESLEATYEERMSMEDALELDGEKLRQITGQDHGPFDLDELLSDDDATQLSG
jgi:hypothetical protein